ncbi:MAG: hypothetical protein EBS34_11180 [Flavobacteriales bacterium]|nr:hypothetical protein [Flavobacteriales bacterium]
MKNLLFVVSLFMVGLLNAQTGTLTDSRDGKIYKTVVIGNQTWMAENLNVDRFRNGDVIPEAKSMREWKKADKEGRPSWCYYKNKTENGIKYGKLYNWYAVSDSRNVCPIGWYVPSDAEWTQMTDLLGGESIAGGKMKSTSLLWSTPNTGATNLSGLSLLPGGARYSNGFGYLGTFGDWWSTTEYDFGTSIDRNLSYVTVSADNYARNKTDGFSVRCVKN